MRESLAITISRGLYAALTLGTLVVSWLIPFSGFAFAFGSAADAKQRVLGWVFLGPGIGALLLLLGLLPGIRGRLLRFLGIGADLLALPFVILYLWHSRPNDAVAYGFLALLYFSSWWILVSTKLH